MRRLALVPVTVLSVTILLLAGCRSSDSGKPRTTDTVTSAPPASTSGKPGPSGPACTDIWKDGATLPSDYTRCIEDGKIGAQDVTKCKDGTKLVAYSDIYFAVTGHKISKPKISPMQDTPEFGKVFASCTGE